MAAHCLAYVVRTFQRLLNGFLQTSTIRLPRATSALPQRKSQSRTRLSSFAFQAGDTEALPSMAFGGRRSTNCRRATSALTSSSWL